MRLIYFFILFLMGSCSSRDRDSHPHTSTDRAKTRVEDTLQPPNIAILRKRLFDYFDRHRHLDSFDTADYTYSDYTGPVQFAPYTATAGHLLNDRQIHAMIFYVDEEGQGLMLYLKDQGNWVKIFEDTTFSYVSGHSYPVFEDWNGDRVKDLVISQVAMMDKIDNYELWLADRSGKKFHYIKEFVHLDNPELDSITGNINCGRYNAGNLHLATYRFKGYTLKDIFDIHIADLSFESKDPDSAIVINYWKNGRQYKEIWCSKKEAPNHVPSDFKRQVEEIF